MERERESERDKQTDDRETDRDRLEHVEKTHLVQSYETSAATNGNYSFCSPTFQQNSSLYQLL